MNLTPVLSPKNVIINLFCLFKNMCGFATTGIQRMKFILGFCLIVYFVLLLKRYSINDMTVVTKSWESDSTERCVNDSHDDDDKS